MESELARLDFGIETAEKELAFKKNSNCRIDSFLEASKEMDVLRCDLGRDKLFAQKNLESIASIEGVQSWRLVSADERNIAVEFVGSVPEASIRLDFSVSSSGLVTCNTSTLSEMESEKKQSRYTSNVKSFFKEKACALQETLLDSSLKSPSEICSVIHHVEWYLGRLDIVGKELSMLEVRYNGKLKKLHGSDKYHLELSIPNKARGAIIETNFEFGDSYPFAMDADISGDANMVSLENHLIKSAKPGFGYMSRSCDVIGAFRGK